MKFFGHRSGERREGEGEERDKNPSEFIHRDIGVSEREKCPEGLRDEDEERCRLRKREGHNWLGARLATEASDAFYTMRGSLHDVNPIPRAAQRASLYKRIVDRGMAIRKRRGGNGDVHARCRCCQKKN